MIVTMTNRQWRYSSRFVPEAAKSTIEIRPKGPRYLELEAPYAAWERTKENILLTQFSPTGGRKPTTSPAIMIPLKKISTVQNMILRHPAMRGLALKGRHGGWFPAWRNRFTGEFSPIPVDNSSFVVLGASWLERPYGVFTIWSPEGVYPRTHRLSDESIHLVAMK